MPENCSLLILFLVTKVSFVYVQVAIASLLANHHKNCSNNLHYCSKGTIVGGLRSLCCCIFNYLLIVLKSVACK